MSLQKNNNSKEFVFIPSLYFMEGLPFTIVTMVATIWFKDLKVGLGEIGLATTILYLPWTLKFIWAPIVDFYGLKKNWILSLQVLLTSIFLLLSLTAFITKSFIILSIILFFIALLSATLDISIDGYYMEVLSPTKQAYYVGFRNTAYKIAWIFGTGFLVWLAGKLESFFSIKNTWAITMLLVSIIIVTIYFLHLKILPTPSVTTKIKKNFNKFTKTKFIYVFLNYFKQPRILAIIWFILFFRLGESLLLKMVSPFLMDGLKNGGLNLSLESIGLIYGTYGMIALLTGGILGGYLISRFGIDKLLFPFALFQNIFILSYVYLSLAKPGLNIISSLNALEQFAYGIGNSAYTVFLLMTVNSKFKASHYAIATALMAFGVFIPQLFSGYLAASFGYPKYFFLCAILSIPGLVSIFFLPLKSLIIKNLLRST